VLGGFLLLGETPISDASDISLCHTILMEPGLRRVIFFVAFANLFYFVVETTVALNIGSTALLADSADFLEDAAVNFLLLLAMTWSAQNRARAGAFMAFLLLLPAAAFLWTAWQKFAQPIPPDAFSLSITAMGALAVNVSCALLLSRYRTVKGSLTKAAFLSARNDAIANVTIITSGLCIAYVWHSAWPDLIVGAAIAILNLDAAREVWEAARDENKHSSA
jgi:Co/Zn/Cd efflux system component